VRYHPIDGFQYVVDIHSLLDRSRFEHRWEFVLFFHIEYKWSNERKRRDRKQFSVETRGNRLHAGSMDLERAVFRNNSPAWRGSPFIHILELCQERP